MYTGYQWCQEKQSLKAIAEELQSFEDIQVWKVVEAPDNANVYWVLMEKFDSDNNVSYRARLVAKAFT